jgi:MoxR-like ATPase
MATEPLEKTVAGISSTSGKILEKLGEFIVGNRQLMELVLIALFSEGHILIEGVPGTAKTTLAKSMACITGSSFNRVQGAIDIQPADIIGVRIYEMAKRDFTLRKGPVFANILLVDEINRINPKSQSAFIEAMSERQATIDGTTLPLPRPFFAMATQNPYEFEGTFPLIEAQRDRFMFSLASRHLGAAEELEIVHKVHGGTLDWDAYSGGLLPLLTSETISACIGTANHIRVEEPVLQYIRNLVMASREHADVDLGASSRASIALVRGGKGMAMIRGRTYVIPDDIREIAPAVFRHRLILASEAEIEGLTPEDVVRGILASVEVL